MSQMTELYNKVADDSKLQEKFTAIMKDIEKRGEAETEANLAKFAKDLSFDISLEEAKSFFKKLIDSKKGELSDSELDMVSGGKMQGSNAVTWALISLASVGIACAVITAINDNDGDPNTNCGQTIENM